MHTALCVQGSPPTGLFTLMESAQQQALAQEIRALKRLYFTDLIYRGIKSTYSGQVLLLKR